MKLMDKIRFYKSEVVMPMPYLFRVLTTHLEESVALLPKLSRKFSPVPQQSLPFQVRGGGVVFKRVNPNLAIEATMQCQGANGVFFFFF